MDGTRYSLPLEAFEQGHRQSRLNFSMIARRLAKVSSWLNKGPHTCSNNFSSRMPVDSSCNHSSLNLLSSWSYGLTVITVLKTSTNHWGSKTTKLLNAGVSSKWTKILWSCRKFNKVKNSWSSSILHTSNAISFATEREIHLWPSRTVPWRALSYFNHLIGVASLIWGSSLATASNSSRSRVTSEHSDPSPADLVLSTTNTSSYMWFLKRLVCKLPNTSRASANGSAPLLGSSAWVQTRNTGGTFTWTRANLTYCSSVTVAREATDVIQKLR